MSTDRIQEIDATASDWLIRRDSGTWSAADEIALEEWLNASTLHRVAFLRLELAWEDAARLKALGAGIPGDRPPPPGSWNLTPFFYSHPAGLSSNEAQAIPAVPNNAHPALDGAPRPATPDSAPALEHDPARAEPGRSRGSEVHGSEGEHNSSEPPLSIRPSAIRSKSHVPRRRFAVATAATLILAVGIGIYVVLPSDGDRYATPVGGFASVPLADGSKVTLNTDSQIRIALTDTERGVELSHGEAFFEVSKDPHRPFVVRAGSKRVIAVGTKFSVRREGDDIEVVVTEGKVRVEEVATTARTPAQGSSDVFLTPGSVARAGEAGVLVQRKTLPEAEEELSWRTGVLMFRDQTLADAVAEFNRYNVRKLVIRDPAVAALKVEGNFRATNVEAFVRLLESGFPVSAQAGPDQIVLTAK